MNLSAILPPQRDSQITINVSDILINCVLCACQHTEFKRIAKWKGLAVCTGPVSGWTIKLSSHAGIFGISESNSINNKPNYTQNFNIYYFPEPNEEILEEMSMTANYSVVQDNYLEAVRNFTHNEKWAQPFEMGQISISINPKQETLSATLSADELKQSIAIDGVKMDSGQWIVPPMENEEKIPAFELSSAIFEVLCAAISNSLEICPAVIDFNITSKKILGFNEKGEILETDKKTNVNQTFFKWAKETDQNINNLTAQQIASLKENLCFKTHNLAALKDDSKYTYLFDERPQLIVLSGFLGSGKTTYLNQLLEFYAAKDEMVAIIQNEIGKTGVDGKLLEGDDSIVELDEGCVCCTLAGNLASGIKKLRSQFDPKVIVLEATGLANPFNILDEIEKLRPLVRFESITTLIDAEHILRQLNESEIAHDQIKAADILIINKSDLISESTLNTVISNIKKINSRAVTITTKFGEVNPATIYDSTPDQIDQFGILPVMRTSNSSTHTTEEFKSTRFEFLNPLRREDLVKVITSLPEEVFRLKGIVKLDDSIDPEVVQYVCGRFEFSKLGSSFEDNSFLIAIGKEADLSSLHNLE